MALKDIYTENKELRKANSRFISLAPGESFEGKFISVENVTGNFGPTRHWTFEVDGKEKIFNKASERLLNAMFEAEVTEGDSVKITAKGNGFDREYIVKKI